MDAKTCQPLLTFKSRIGNVHAAAFIADDSRVVTSAGWKVKVWDATPLALAFQSKKLALVPPPVNR